MNPWETQYMQQTLMNATVARASLVPGPLSLLGQDCRNVCKTEVLTKPTCFLRLCVENHSKEKSTFNSSLCFQLLQFFHSAWSMSELFWFHMFVFPRLQFFRPKIALFSVASILQDRAPVSSEVRRMRKTTAGREVHHSILKS